MNANGHLIKDKTKFPVVLYYQSKFSLVIEITPELKKSNNKKFDKCIIKLSDREYELGGCRIIEEKKDKQTQWKLFFTKDIYDFENLFYFKKMTNLNSYFQNVNLIINQRNDVSDSFKLFTADLTFDLEVYKQFFDDLEAKYKDESKAIQKSIEKVILDSEGKKFLSFFDDKLDELNLVIKDFTREEHERHGFYFRKQVWSFILCSEFIKRINIKPRGYIGDSEMMTAIYENKYRGKSIFSKLLHKHPLDQKGAQAVRNRRHLIADELKKLKDKQKDSSKMPIKFLSVACGPAFELKDIYLTSLDAKIFQCTLMDQDKLALGEAQKNISQLENKLKVKIKAKFLSESIRTVIGVRNLEEKWGSFHFLYTMGLFDYLTPLVARAVLKKLYKLLLPGGKMVIGNFHVTNPNKYYMEYWMDWVLFYRTEEDFLELMKDIPDAKCSVIFEETKTQIFLIVQKPG